MPTVRSRPSRRRSAHQTPWTQWKWLRGGEDTQRGQSIAGSGKNIVRGSNHIGLSSLPCPQHTCTRLVLMSPLTGCFDADLHNRVRPRRHCRTRRRRSCATNVHESGCSKGTGAIIPALKTAEMKGCPPKELISRDKDGEIDSGSSIAMVP